MTRRVGPKGSDLRVVSATSRPTTEDTQMRIHPIVTRLVGPEALAKLGVRPIENAEV